MQNCMVHYIGRVKDTVLVETKIDRTCMAYIKKTVGFYYHLVYAKLHINFRFQHHTDICVYKISTYCTCKIELHCVLPDKHTSIE